MPENSGKPFKLIGFAGKSHKENRIAITGVGAFESLRPDHSSDLALLTIMSKGFLYTGVTLTASTEQFENSILSNLAFSTEFCEKYSK